jgi:membrane fusion protein (multidrug efflux system)
MNVIRKAVYAVMLLLPCIIFSSCTNSGDENAQIIQPVDIKVEVLHPSPLVDVLQVAGTVKALQDAVISPEEGGVVKEWIARKGQYVNKGDVILLLKDEILKAGFDAAEAQYKLAELNLEKQKKVYEEQGISELQYKTFEYNRDAAKANADLMEARYERTKIKSPINGIVDNIIPNVGEYAPPGVPIARVVNTSTVKIQAEIPEKASASISRGDNSYITFDALPGDTLRGKIGFISTTVSSANRAVLIEIVIKNPVRKLKPEMIGKVNIFRSSKQNALLVNESLIQLVDRNRKIVYIENSGKALECQVETGSRQGNRIEIISGLQTGDNVIIAGYQKLADGTPVVVRQ